MEVKIKTKNLMKKSINLSKKERNLLILLLIVVIFWMFYKLVFTKQAIKIAELKQEKNECSEELLKIDGILSKDKIIATEWEKMNEEVRNIQNKFFPTIDQPEIMHMLNGIIDNNSLKVSGMYFRESDYVMVGYIETKYLGVLIPFKGSYNELWTFLSQLNSSPKRFLVSQLLINKGDDGLLNGQISLNAYSHDEIIDSGLGSSYTAGVQKVIKEDPFIPHEDYTVEIEENTSVEEINIAEEIEKRIILEDFEGEELYFMPTSSNSTGKVDKFGCSKHGKYSLRAEYLISTENKEERVYVVLDDKDIYLKYPPSSIGIWTYSYGYSPVILGLRFQDQEGNKIDLEIVKGMNWTGWEFIETMPPQDIKLYPLKLDRVYIELGANRDDYGVILFDNIEATYPLADHDDRKQAKEYLFYLVQQGDTLESISEKVYGTKSEYNAIMKQNGLNNNCVLEAGQILVIPK